MNQAFADAALEVLRPGDLLWIHDYHLMLLPQLIRARRPHLSIGFFLHIPFPHYEIFRLLPAQWRRELLDGLLGADVIGFHTVDYGQYFYAASCVCSVTKARWVKYWSTTAGSKSAALRHWLRDQEFDFVLAVGDDHDDEELFTALPARGYSIRVGIGRTNAHFNLRESKDVIKLLEELRWAQSPPKAAVNHRG